jgi:hypothetical protein
VAEEIICLCIAETVMIGPFFSLLCPDGYP